MTDNEIINGLDCCANLLMCNKCQYSANGCLSKLKVDALSLIYSQKAEIESLANSVRLQIGMIYDTRTESIKEFAEELKRRLIDRGLFPVLVKNEIDNLVKEMTEEHHEMHDTAAGEE